MTQLIDSHCHLHDTEFFPDGREDVYRRAIDADVTMVCVGTDVRSSREAVEFVASHDRVFAVVGIHPHEAEVCSTDDIKALLQENPPNTIYGIGEIGLDYFYEHSPKQTQITRLEEQLQLAVDYDLPVSFHVREAFEDFWAVFDNFHGVRGVLHSFTDTQVQLEQGFERGLYVGVNGISTFTKDAAQQHMYANIPLEKMLLETDAPYLTPAPLRGTMNEPSFVGRVAEHVATQRNVSFSDVAAATTANARRLLNIA